MRTALVVVPEWDTAVRVRELDGHDRDELETLMHGPEGNRTAWLVVKSVVDNEGRRIFADSDLAEVAALPARSLRRIADVAFDLSGLTHECADRVERNLKSRPERRLYLRLALARGCSVEELLATTSSRELTEWQIFAEVEPFGEARADLRDALIAATIANVNRDPKARPQPFTPADFLIDYEARWRGDEDEDDEATEAERLEDAARLLDRMAQTQAVLTASR